MNRMNWVLWETGVTRVAHFPGWLVKLSFYWGNKVYFGCDRVFLRPLVEVGMVGG